MKAYSLDLRQKLIDAHKNHEGSYRQLAKRFSVSLSFVQTLLRRYQETGRCDALPHGGGKQPKLNREHLEILQQLVASNNDATLAELCGLLESKTQVRVSVSTIGRIVQSLKLTRKKKHSMPANKILNESES
jgi:transposase